MNVVVNSARPYRRLSAELFAVKYQDFYLMTSYIVQPSVILRITGSRYFYGLVSNTKVIPAVLSDCCVSPIVREDPTKFLIHLPDTQVFIH